MGYLDDRGIFSGEPGARVIYCTSALPALKLARKMGGRAIISRTAGSTRWVAFEIGEAKYYPGVYTSDVSQIIAWRDYCHDNGIAARSVQAMAFYLMRSTLAGWFEVSKGWEIPFFLFPTGARMQAVPGLYRNVIQSDIRSAYLWGIGRFTPGGSFRKVKASPESIVDEPGAWALVRYRNPSRDSWGAIPEMSESGSTIFPTNTPHWSSAILLSSYDIACGIASGARFRVQSSWVPNRGVSEPFREFMIEICRQRKTSPFPEVAKQAGNTLWGNFCASSKQAVVIFGKGGRHKIHTIPRRKPLCLPIGYSIIGLLRSRLYLEGIGSTTIHAHTDGVISPYAVPEGNGNPGEWRESGTFAEVEVISPSWYRTVGHDGEVTYKTAGRNERGERAAKLFAHHRDRLYGDKRSPFAKALADGI